MFFVVIDILEVFKEKLKTGVRPGVNFINVKHANFLYKSA